MSEESFKDTWEDYSKLDRLGILTYCVLLVGFLVGLAYLMYFSGEFERLKDVLGLDDIDNAFQLANMIYSVLICLGLVTFSGLYYRIVELIFYPETKAEILISKKKKEYEKKYPSKIAELKLMELRAKIILDDIAIKIKEVSK